MENENEYNLLKLLKKEFDNIQKDEKEIKVKLVNNDLKHWKARIKGPMNTCYEGGVFDIDIIIPEEYFFKPPKMRFETKIWHPNISSVTGAIGLDILKNEWCPALRLRTAIISVQALMSAPVPEEPQDAVVAHQYLNNIEEFNQKAKLWVKLYANSEPETNLQNQMEELLKMGFEEKDARQALKDNDNDLDKAINSLIK